MKLKFLLVSIAIFLTTTSSAMVVENSLEGLGLESLMGGIGQARFGSNGALSSNPALLAWLPQKHEYLSTNLVKFYKQKTNTGFSMSPNIVPRMASSSEGFGGKGHSYGVIIDSKEANLEFINSTDRTSAIYESQEITLAYAMGYKVSNNTAFGFGTFVGRRSENSTSSNVGSSSGVAYSYNGKSTQSIWVHGISAGIASAYEEWGWGLSTKITTATFAATSYTRLSGYTEGAGSTDTTVSHDIDRTQVLPDFRAGLQRIFEEIKIFFDLRYQISYTDPDLDTYFKSRIFSSLGFQKNLDEVYKLYGGFTFKPSENEYKESGTLNLGLSKKNKHSLNYGGLGLDRQFKSADPQIFSLVFGTIFEY